MDVGATEIVSSEMRLLAIGTICVAVGLTGTVEEDLFDEASMNSGIAFIAELPDAANTGRFSAQFAAHWESRDGKSMRKGPAGVSLQDALAWARNESEYVSVLFGGENSAYSAGSKPLRDDVHRPWLGDSVMVRPRPVGTPLDGSQQSIEWRVHVVMSNNEDGTVVGELAKEVGSDDAVSRVATRSGLLEIGVHSDSSSNALLSIEHVVGRALSRLTGRNSVADFESDVIGPWSGKDSM